MGVVVLLFCVLQTHQGHKVSTEKREKTPREDKYTSYIQLASVIYKNTPNYLQNKKIIIKN